ncbi:MAG: UDP-N-acetylmuramoyl-L-alanyl-D-glutamate--2,6-diaminopimelate ligase [Fimbriimonadaceae bacterium]|nr:UDP-N-acetylmuramoyl-L-alanyl-D-glutamate--2,6-diaminopimelate ligase [Fimbriimonadaceae bacterium]
MRLTLLCQMAGVPFDAISGDAEVLDIVQDSRIAKPGDLFVCMPGHRQDSHGFLGQARERGAVAALVHSSGGLAEAERTGLAAALATDTGVRWSATVGALCKAFFGDPTATMRVVGVTGTNGKTTTAWLVRAALDALGEPAAYLGTLGLATPIGMREIANTTPFSVELHGMIREATSDGARALAMEVSSHALEEDRVAGISFDVGVFTNLTQDHLDYHGTMEAYAAAKRRLFEAPGRQTKPFVAVLNVGDPTGAAWSREFAAIEVATGSAPAPVAGNRRLTASPHEVTVDRLELGWTFEGATAASRVPIGGTFNVDNAATAMGALLGLGYGLEASAAAMERVLPAPGRFEAVPNDRGFGVLVDYAHTPDALEKLLDAVRALNPRRIVTVFGCGGDRDRTKRPKMARAASERSDVTVVTSDNPRTEDPLAILEDTKAGLVAGRESHAIVDRREAVALAIGLARPGDVVVIAGKGHENYQIIGRTKYPMDDRELVRSALEGTR